MDGAVLNINSTTYNLNLAALSTSLYGSVLPYTILNVNAPIYGSDGINGVLKKVPINIGDFYILSNPTVGTSAINLSGFSGKAVKINNNSTVKGGNGGNGVSGGSYNPTGTIYCEVNIFYGALGGIAISNSSGVNLSISGNSTINGSNGFNRTYYAYCQNSNSG